MYDWLRRECKYRTVAEMSIWYTIIAVGSFMVVILIWSLLTGVASDSEDPDAVAIQVISLLVALCLWLAMLIWLWIGLVRTAWKWGHERLGSRLIKEFSSTDAVGVMKNGIELGKRTFGYFLKEMGWGKDDVDRIIAHQVAKPNRVSALEAGGIPEEKEFPTFHYLGNMGSVSLPATAAIAEEQGFLQSGNRVSFFGIGSGLVCMMLGLEW